MGSPISEEMWDFPTVSVTLLMAEVIRGRKWFVWVLVLRGYNSLWKVRQLVHSQEAEIDGYGGTQVPFLF